MHRCLQCGGRLRRIHRSLIERLHLMAIWRCEACAEMFTYPRGFASHFGPHCVCPVCNTVRVTRLHKPDKIDRMRTGVFNFMERLAGGRLYHCRYCRLQFWDRRPLAREIETRSLDLRTGPPAPVQPDAAGRPGAGRGANP